MKKLSKRFLTLAIAGVMAMAMSVQAFADNATQVPPPPTPVEMEVESSLKDVPLQSNGPVSDCYVVPQELILADQQKAKEEAASISLVIPEKRLLADGRLESLRLHCTNHKLYLWLGVYPNGIEKH